MNMGRWVWRLAEILLRWWLGEQKLRAIRNIKAEGIRTYLKVLQGVRLSAIGIVALLVTMQMLCFGLALMIGAGVFLAPLELEVKLWAVFIFGAGLFFVPFVALMFLLSERIWYKASGADTMVKQILEKEAG
jgi:hypothetical protein